MTTRLALAGRRLREDPDVYLALLAIGLGLLAIVLSARGQGSFIAFGILSAALAGLYLLYRRRAARGSRATHLTTTPLLVLSLLFVIALGVAIGLLGTQSYTIPVAYHLMVAAAYALVCIQALWLSDGQKSAAWVILLEVLALAVLLRLSQTFLYPGMLGVDPWVTSSVSANVKTSGFLPMEISPGLSFGYRSFPFYYINVTIFSLITQLDIKSSLALSVTLPQAISIVFLFLAGRSLGGTRVGLLVALFASLNKHHVNWAGINAIPMSLAIIYFSLILFLLLKAWQANSFTFRAILLFCLVALVFTHTITSLIMAIVLTVFYIGFKAHQAVFGAQERQRRPLFGLPVGAGRVFFFGAVMLTYWLYASGFFWEVAKAIRYALQVAAQELTPPIAVPRYASFVHRLAAETEYLILVELIILGGLLWLFKGNRRPERSMVLIITFVLFMVIRISDWTDVDILLPGRWEVFYYILWGFPAAFVLVELARVFRASALVSIGAVFVLAFVMSISPLVVILPPLYPAESRVALFSSELAAVQSLKDPLQGALVVTDSPYDIAWQYGYGYGNVTELDERIFREGEYPPGALYLLRQYVLDHPLTITDPEKETGYLSKTLDIGPQVLQQMQTAPYDKIYSNGVLWGYYR